LEVIEHHVVNTAGEVADFAADGGIQVVEDRSTGVANSTEHSAFVQRAR
jgi:hypothetical protein